MINLDECYLFGILTKPHGVRGEVILRLNSFSFEDIKDLESVFIEIDGLPVPFFIHKYSERPPDSLIIQFDDIISEQKARNICGSQVYIHKSNILKKENIILQDFNTLLQYKISDEKHGSLGVLNDILDYEHNPILQIINDNGEILIPLQPEFIKEINHTEKIIYVTTPNGLINLIQ